MSPNIVDELQRHARELEAAAQRYYAECRAEDEVIRLYEAGEISLDALMSRARFRDAAWKHYFELSLVADDLLAKSVRMRRVSTGATR